MKRKPALKLPPDPVHTQRIVSAPVQGAISHTLRRCGVPTDDRDALAMRITEELLVCATRPDDTGRCVGLARRAARFRALDYFRRRVREARVLVGLTADADLHPARDGLELEPERSLLVGAMKELWQKLREQGEIDALQERLLRLKASGVSTKEIARKVKLAPGTVDNRLSMARKVARAAWRARNTIALGLLLLALGFLAWSRRKSEEARRHDIGPDFGVPTGPEVPTPVEQAEALRRDAFEACDLHDFFGCAGKLDEAAGLDPTSEQRPDVRRAREAIDEANAPVQPRELKPRGR